uniref:Alpha-1,3-glucosyltransferase n=1 Tax=Rhodnius prolixus TaxID=13249 RepID=A0A4P6D8I7_RHOPR
MDEKVTYSGSKSNRKSLSLWVVVIVGVLLRWVVSFYGYSGQGNPPMYGDYEAQRHWMEVTVNLPVKEWYVNTTRNDLLYWGLDYPPFTAYHSLICGYIAILLNPAYVQYNVSRGYESPEHKLFMRSTVLISDLFTYITAACLYSKAVGSNFLTVVLLIYPGLILIDHGHFQYNCVSLGLALLAFIAFLKNKDLVGSLLFCLAINFKQMLLYYSLPIFFYLLGKTLLLDWKNSVIKLVSLGATVMITFTLVWWPFINVAHHVMRRIFPIERGLFEDKVSNMWCLVNVLIKVRNYFGNTQLAMISALITLSTVLPSSLDVFKHPTHRKLVLSLINSSLAFFLFSYQVHEKTILLVSLPVMLYYEHEPMLCLWFLEITSLSMLPLLIKDNLVIPFISLNIMYIVILCCFTSSQKKKSKSFILVIVSAILSWTLFVLSISVSPPSSYPHLYPLLISVFCTFHFFGFFIFFNWKQLVKIKET